MTEKPAKGMPIAFHRARRSKHSLKERIKLAQLRADANRDIPLTLPKAPWEKDASE